MVATNSVWNAIIKDAVSVKSKGIWSSQALMTFEQNVFELKDILNILNKINLIHFFSWLRCLYIATHSLLGHCVPIFYILV